jgi:hypothetical protein
MPKIYIHESDAVYCYFETAEDFEKEWGVPYDEDLHGSVSVNVSDELLEKYRQITKEYSDMQSFLFQAKRDFYE